MKKKICILMFAICCLCLSACNGKDVNIDNYLIEERQNLYTAQDDLYTASFSSGLREADYSFDGIKNEMVQFGIITISRIDCASMSKDDYVYTIKINDQTFTGNLQPSTIDNSYCADIEASAPENATVSLQITFTGYSFNKEMINTSANFTVDKSGAIQIANNALKEDINQLTSNKNTQIEAVMKIVKDSSTEQVNYYWYVGIVSTDGNVLGVLVDTASGEIIAKKV